MSNLYDLYAWGSNQYGQLGDGTNIDKNTPILIEPVDIPPQGFFSIGSGYSHSMAIGGISGSGWAWGRNDYGQLACNTNIDKNTPTSGGSIGNGFLFIDGGTSHTIALKNDGTLWTSGDNSVGQLGDGTYLNQNTFTLIGTGYSAISSGYAFCLALKNDGSLWAWGANFYGESELGSNKNTPTLIGTGYSAISAGLDNCLALKSDGSLWAWGANYQGQLGDGTYIGKTTPTLIGSGYFAISAGSKFCLAIKNNGDLYAWGDNTHGQLGDGTNIDKNIPTLIGTGYSKISAGDGHSLAIKNNGDLYAWGNNDHGQLGDGTNIDKNIPTLIGTGYSAVSAGGDHSLALFSNITPTPTPTPTSTPTTSSCSGLPEGDLDINCGAYYANQNTGCCEWLQGSFYYDLGIAQQFPYYYPHNSFGLADCCVYGLSLDPGPNSESCECPTATPTATPIATPTPTPGPTSCDICFRMACEACSVSPTPTPTEPPIGNCTPENCSGYPCPDGPCCGNYNNNCSCCPEADWVCCPGTNYCAAGLADCPSQQSSVIAYYYPIPIDENLWSDPFVNITESIYNIKTVSINENTNKMYVTSDSDLVFTIDLSNNAITNSYSVGTSGLVGIAVNQNNNHYYVLGSDLVDVNASNNTKTVLASVGTGYAIKYEPINNRIYYVSDTGSGFAKLAYWNLNTSEETVLGTFSVTLSGENKCSIDATIHKIFVSLTDLNQVAIFDLLTANISYVDVYANSRGISVDNSNTLYLLNSSGETAADYDDSIIVINEDNIISNIWGGGDLSKPTFIKLNQIKNKIYIGNEKNTLIVRDTITGFNVSTSYMPDFGANFTDLKITSSGILYGVYNNRIVVFNESALP